MSDETLFNERERIATISDLCVNSSLRWSARVVSSFYDDKLCSIGLHANQVALLVVPYLAGSISINKMAERIGLDRTTLVRNLKLLEEGGLITMKPGKDLRMRMVTLTSKGHDTLIAALPLWEEAQKQVLELLGSQHAELVKALELVNTLENKA
jgi:DNA-binding MarR family transcriptional regulator